MKITLFGAAGAVGSRILSEALARGHEVTAVVRNRTQFGKLPEHAMAEVGDAGRVEDVVRLLTGQDLAISALRPPEGREALLVPLTRAILDGAALTGVRVLIVGGAASLRMPGDGRNTVLSAPDFLPDSVVPIARACQAQYELCLAEREADWSYLSPPAMLTPGDRSGSYRTGRDVLLTDADGQSRISMEDFAVALLDEAETPHHARERFTVAA